MTETTTQFKRQLPRNSFFQMLSFISHVVIGIWLVPYLVRHLGRAAYGLIPIAGMMTQYVALISHSISSAVNRFLTIALQQNDSEEANRIFNTAFFSYLAIGLLQIPIFALVVYYARTIFSIPPELHRDVIILLVCSATSFLINLVCSVFTVPMYSSNRLDISRGLDIARIVLRLFGILTLFVVSAPALRYVGYVDLTLTLILCLAHIKIARWLAPMLHVASRYYDWRKVRELTGMGGWLLIAQMGFLLSMRVDVWVCNRFISAEAAGDYAAIMQWSNLIRQVGSLLAAASAPMIMIYYARSEIESLIRLSRISVRVLSLVLAVPVGALCAFSPAVLGMWLGPSFAGLAPLMVIMLCHLVINVGVMPLFAIRVAVNRVRLPALVSIFAGVVNVGLAISFVKHLNWGIYGVAVAGAVVVTAKNSVFAPIHAARVLGLPWHTFVTPCLFALGLMVSLTMLGCAVNYRVELISWADLAIACATIGTVGSVAVWVGLPKRDRLLIRDMFPCRFQTGSCRTGN